MIFFKKNVTYFPIYLAFFLVTSVYAELRTHSAVFDSHRSVESGCLIAEKNMKRLMVENQCGTNLQGGGMRFKSDTIDSLAKMHLEIVNGYVTKWDDISTSVKVSQDGKSIECSVKADIEASCNSGKRSADFQSLNATLNQLVFFEDDDMKIQIDSAPHDRYLTIVQLITQSSGKQEIWKIFPNLFQSMQLLKANVDMTIPNGYRLSAKNSLEKNVSDEGLILIATKSQPAKLPEKMSIEYFYSWLVSMRLEDRREVLIPYRIIKKVGKL